MDVVIEALEANARDAGEAYSIRAKSCSSHTYTP